MAKDGGSVEINANVSVNIDGADIVARKLEDVAKDAKNLSAALSSISRGNDLNKYWKNQASGLDNVCDAFERFNDLSNNNNAANLFKTYNAFIAKGGDVEQLFSRYGDSITDAVRRAGEMQPVLREAFSVESLRNAFSAFDQMKAYGADMTEVFGKLNSPDSRGLESALDSMTRKFEITQNALRQTEAELENYMSGEGYSQLREQVAQFEDIRDRMKYEFQSFLEGNNIVGDDASQWGRFGHLFDNIADGSSTANEAIQEFKRTYSEFLTDRGGGGGVFSPDQVDYFTSQLEEAYATVQRIEGIVNKETMSNVAGYLGQSPELSEAQRASVENIASQQANIESITQLLTELISASSGADTNIDNIYQSISRLVEATSQLSGANLENLQNMRGIFSSMLNMGDLDVSKSSLNNIVTAIDGLASIANNGTNLNQLSAIDLSGFNNLKVTKATVTNLTNLAQGFQGVDTSSLEKLASINFDNLNNLKVNKSTVDNLTALSEIQKAVEGFSAITESIDKLNASMEALGKTGGGKGGSGASNVGKVLEEGSDAWASKMNNTTKQIQSMEDFYKSMSDISGLDSSGKQQLENYRAVIDLYKDLQTELSGGKMQRGDFNKSFTYLSEEANKAKSELKEVAEAQKKFNAEQEASKAKAQADLLTKDNPAFKTNMLEVTRQIESMEKFRNSMNKIAGLDQSGAAELEKYTSTLDKIKQLSADLDSGKMTKGEYNTRFTNLAKEASEAKIELQEVADKQKQLNEEQAKSAQGSFAENFVKQQNALREISKLQQEIAQNSKKWSAAENGRSSGAYAEYIKQGEALEKLNQEVSNGSMDEYSQRISEIKANMQDCATAISNAGENTQGFGAQLAGAFRYFSMYFGMTRMVMKGIQTVKQMVQASIDIESAMNRIQIVTGATDSQMGQFFDSASQQAQDLGQNITDVASSIETFSRLGYSLGDATDLSKYATIMSNVADTTVDAATTGLTSIIKGFGMEASDAEHVSDVLINVGQKYAISAEELMEAFERGGAAMNASGTSFEESAALFAATNASLQNASTTGTLWKTVSARIRGAKTE